MARSDERIGSIVPLAKNGDANTSAREKLTHRTRDLRPGFFDKDVRRHPVCEGFFLDRFHFRDAENHTSAM
jgi:hypothetical protein